MKTKVVLMSVVLLGMASVNVPIAQTKPSSVVMIVTTGQVDWSDAQSPWQRSGILEIDSA